MAVIPCGEINQTINYLTTAFADCTYINPEDLRMMVDLIAAVNTCANGGTHYDTLLNNIYEPDTTEVVTYPIGNFHAISLVIESGSIIYQGITLSAGASINIEFTTTNQQAFTFTVNAGSKILVERIIETL